MPGSTVEASSSTDSASPTSPSVLNSSFPLTGGGSGLGATGEGGANQIPPEVQQLFSSLSSEVTQLTTEVSLLTQVVQLDQAVSQLSSEVSQLQSELGKTSTKLNGDNSTGTVSNANSNDGTSGVNGATNSGDKTNAASTNSASDSTNAASTNIASDSTNAAGTNIASDSTNATGTNSAGDGTNATGTNSASDSTNATGTNIASDSTNATGTNSAGDGTNATGTNSASDSTNATGTNSAGDGTNATGTNSADDGTNATGTNSVGDSTNATGVNSAGDNASASGTDSTGSGGYEVLNGQIIGPNGQPYDAKGVAVYASQAPAEAATIFQAMPDANFIRLTASASSDTPQDVQTDIQALDSAYQAANPGSTNLPVIEVEDVYSPGTDGTTNNTLSGSALTQEESWYSQIAANNVNSPNVWFATANEPNDPSNEQDVVDQEVGIYNAVRSTGNNSMVMLEAQGGGSFGAQEGDVGAYNSMTNVAWDDHYYNWASGYSTSESANYSALQNEVAGSAGITESDGNGGQQAIPTIIGEYGNSTNGQTQDAGATASIDAVQTANNNGLVQGAVAWTWNGNNEANNSDAITQDGTLNTETGQGEPGGSGEGSEMINYVNTGQIGAVDN
jgi:hypothetical protein